MINTINLPPFKKMCITIGNLPSSFMESMSYYEALCWLYNYLDNTIIPAINTESEAITELQTAFTTLKTYVDTYFDDLDVQENINNKLDDMAESGELTEIIAQYLQLAGILAYNTVADLKGAENLVEGSFTKTYGQTTYNDGYGAFYKIRALINTDVIDEDNIVALTNYPTLIAEKMHDADITNLETNINLLKSNRVILVGDSYSLYRPETAGIVGWQVPLQTLLGLTDADCIKIQDNGGGFADDGDLGTFLEALQGTTITSPSTITKIVVCGGYNDIGKTGTNLRNAISNFISYCKTTFPNAKVYIGMIANNKDIAGVYDKFRMFTTVLRMYKQCTRFGGIYLNGVEYIMKNYTLYYDNNHPNLDGCNELAYGIYEALMGGSCNVYYATQDINTLTNSVFTTTTIPFEETLVNNNWIFHYVSSTLSPKYTLSTATSSRDFAIADIPFNYFRPTFSYQTIANGMIEVTYSDTTTAVCPFILYVASGTYKLCIQIFDNSTSNISGIKFYDFHTEIDAIVC